MVRLLRNYWQLTVSQWTQQLWPVTSQITQLHFIYSWPNPKECIGTSGFQIKGWRQEMEVMWVKLLYWSWIFRHLYLSIYFSVISLLLFPTFLQKISTFCSLYFSKQAHYFRFNAVMVNCYFPSLRVFKCRTGLNLHGGNNNTYKTILFVYLVQ